MRTRKLTGGLYSKLTKYSALIKDTERLKKMERSDQSHIPVEMLRDISAYNTHYITSPEVSKMSKAGNSIAVGDVTTAVFQLSCHARDIERATRRNGIFTVENQCHLIELDNSIQDFLGFAKKFEDQLDAITTSESDISQEMKI
jgi:hypothetical protein